MSSASPQQPVAAGPTPTHDPGSDPITCHDTGGAHAAQSQAPRRQGQGRAPPRRTRHSVTGKENLLLEHTDVSVQLLTTNPTQASGDVEGPY